MEHLKLAKLYEEGAITEMEFVTSFFPLVTPENVRLLLASTPADLREKVIDRAHQLKGVDAVKTFCIQCVVYTGGYDKEAQDKRMAEESQKYLRGAEIVRDYTTLEP